MLKINDQIWLTGGYDMTPEWLEGKEGYSATLLSFKDTDLGTLSIIELSQKIKSSDVESEIVIMQLRYKDAIWDNEGIVHIYLCNEIPTSEFISREWISNNSIWLESHANYKKT